MNTYKRHRFPPIEAEAQGLRQHLLHRSGIRQNQWQAALLMASRGSGEPAPRSALGMARC